MQKIKANDDQTLRMLYAANYKKVEQYIIQNNGSADDARDIYQEAFLATWRNIQFDKFEPRDETSLSGYIFQIAKNKWMDQLRSMKRKKTIPLDEMDPVDDTPAGLSKDETDYIEKVKIHFETLGDQCRELLKRFYFDKESLKEIAGFFSWTEASAKNNKYRCLQKLRNMVTQKNKDNY